MDGSADQFNLLNLFQREHFGNVLQLIAALQVNSPQIQHPVDAFQARQRLFADLKFFQSGQVLKPGEIGQRSGLDRNLLIRFLVVKDHVTAVVVPPLP